MGKAAVWTLVLLVLGHGTALAEKRNASLRGSPASMVEQNQVARAHGLTFYRTAAQIRQAVAHGALVELTGNDDYEVASFVRYPYLQPELRVFVERLSAQYRAACGEKLVVTSAVRPSNGQPPNAHRLSVHPAGMAVDLRVSDRAACRAWLENALINLERRGVLNGIREFRPPHYHVAVYPGQYMAFVAERLAADAQARAPQVVPRSFPPVEDIVPAVAASFVATESAAPAPSGEGGRLAAALAMLIAIPAAARLLVRRWRRRGSPHGRI
jgi:hypothetical protein